MFWYSFARSLRFMELIPELGFQRLVVGVYLDLVYPKFLVM